MIDGQIFAEKVPATFLLGMESRLARLREMYTKIPTLAPGTKWELDENLGKGIFATAHPEVKFITEKTLDFLEVAKATKEHPAQVREFTKDVQIGKRTTTRWSGMISPVLKSEMLERLDTLRNAVKQARQRANAVEVKNRKLAQDIFNYIHTGK